VTGGDVLELRMRRSWRLIVATAVVVAATIIVLGCWSLAFEDRVDVPAALLIVFILVTLGGLIVVPGLVMLTRLARGVPTVRIDDRGIVWGDDRSRDLSIDWADVAGVTVRTVTNQVVPDRVLVIRPREGFETATPASRYGRVVAALNRSTHGTPFAISTVIADQPVEGIRDAVASRLGGMPVEAR
jgi:hypothetical protein